MKSRESRGATGAGRRGRSAWIATLLAAVLTAAGVPTAAAANAAEAAALDCKGWLGTPVSGSAAWNAADLNNLQCAAEGLRILQESPAVAAAKAANANAAKAPSSAIRSGRRTDGQASAAATSGSPTPIETGTRGRRRCSVRVTPAGPRPGVLLVCHACFPLPQTTENVGLWYWAAESLAEAGYVVLYATVGGNNVSRTIDSDRLLHSHACVPDLPRGVQSLVQGVGPHPSGNRRSLRRRGVALNVGNSDPRFDAIVAWDPASSASLTGVTPRTPTMIQVADYTLAEGPVPRTQRPIPAEGSKYTFYDTIRAAGVDVMQISPHASTHLDWTHFAAANPFGPSIDHGLYGEMVATYYTLAWLDRYVAMSAKAKDALRRLTASGTDRFDRSADVHSIGAGFSDAEKARRAGNPEAGNVPITIGGLPIRNLLSFQYDSRYFLKGGALHCEDMRARCP